MSTIITSSNVNIPKSVLKVLDNARILQLDSQFWSGTKAVTDPKKYINIPSDLHTNTSKKIFNVRWLKELDTQRKAWRREAFKVGTSFGKGLVIMNDDEFSEIRPALDKTVVDWHIALDELGRTYEAKKELFREESAIHGEEWAKFIEESQLSWSEVKHSFHFEYITFKIDTDNLDESLVKRVASSQASIYKDIRMLANKQLTESADKESTTQRIRKPVESVIKKLRSLEFLDKDTGNVADYCESFMDSLPKKGSISGNDFVQLKLFFKSLTDCESMKSLVTKKSKPSVIVKNLPRGNRAKSSSDDVAIVSEDSETVPTDEVVSTEKQLDMVGSNDKASDDTSESDAVSGDVTQSEKTDKREGEYVLPKGNFRVSF